MSYLVLARKYRPSTFSEVVGQEHVTRTLMNAFATNRVHHAFLMTGPRGCGKTTVARIVGKALNCTALANGEPCGTCSACTSIGNGSAVDYQEMDGASNRGIDAIRELTEAVRYQPAVLAKKVYVIDEVHMLTTEAFNALLKTLEEPPPHVTFVLATTEPHKLPNTILSRCQRYDFKLVPASRLAQHLTSIFKQEQLAIEPGAVSLLVRESGGSVRDALSLSDQIISYVGDAKITEAHVAEVLGVADRTLTRTLVTALATGEAGPALAAVEAAIERGVDEVQLARAIVRYLRDLAVLQVAPERGEQLVNDASAEALAELAAEAARLDRSRVAQMFDRMLRCCDELGKTLQPRLVLDCALIDVAALEPLVPLGDLLDRLGELEGRLAGKGAVRAVATGGGGGPTFKSTTPGASIDPPRRPASPAPAKTEASDRSDRPAQGAPAHVRTERFASTVEAAPPPPPDRDPRAERAEHADRSAGHRADRSAPVSMQPSGPVPKAEKTASGSGPQREGAPKTDHAAKGEHPVKGDDHAAKGDDAAKGRLASTLPGVGPSKPTIVTPTTAAEALAAWAKVIDYLEAQRKISLRGYYEFARVLAWTKGELELGFAADHDSRWAGENASEKANVDELRAVLGELGHKLKVTVRLLDDAESTSTAARSIIESTRAQTSAERNRRETEAREHPITKHVLQTFGAHIKEIKTDV
jgi:DNA polymerase III subunit gamma/tau